MTYKTLDELIDLIDEPNKERCWKIYSENEDLFREAKASSHNHQTWQGGYISHIQEVMNIGITLYETLNKKRELPFSLSDALLVLYLHDIEKPWKYGGYQGDVPQNHEEQQAFMWAKIEEYGFDLTKDHKNALTYVHGEGKDYTPKRRTQTPLAAFVHTCDTISARIWYNHSRKGNY